MTQKTSSKTDQVLSTTQLDRSLGRKELMSIAIGQIVGAGIMAMTGTAIGMTGKTAWIAFLISSLFMIATSLPTLLVAGTVRLRGGNFSLVQLLGGKYLAGAFTIYYIIANMTIAMYGLSFADYFLGLIPLPVPKQFIALIILTIFFIINFRGVKNMAFLENVMVALMLSSLALFCVFGLPKCHFSTAFSGPDFMPGGVAGLLGAATILRFATGGATATVYFGAEAKNPTKDIPFVIIVATIGVAFFYAILAFVAANVLPVSEVANKSLLLVAKEIFPLPLYLFFTIGGAWMALTTTLNATFGWVTKPVLQACADGWLPKSLGTIHPKFNTPYKIQAIFYAVAVIVVLTGYNINAIAKFATTISTLFYAIVAFLTIRLPKAVPEIWEKSKYKCSMTSVWIISLIGTGVNLFQCYMVYSTLTKVQAIGATCVFIISIIFMLVRVKKVNPEISYEAS